MKLVIVSNNAHKIEEIKPLLPNTIELLSLKEIGCFEELPETQTTLEGNANQKAKYVYDNYGYNCFADDTGLEIEALNGEPGVYSAHYAGTRNAEDNMYKVLEGLKGQDNRKACFRTIISLIINGEEHQFEGRVDGSVLETKQGEKGFGYDPIFQPDGYDISFAQMPMETKSKISHRGRAVAKLVEYLSKF